MCQKIEFLKLDNNTTAKFEIEYKSDVPVTKDTPNSEVIPISVAKVRVSFLQFNYRKQALTLQYDELKKLHEELIKIYQRRELMEAGILSDELPF